MRFLSEAFRKIVRREADAAFRLGEPAADGAALSRRMNAMASLTQGRGFRVPPKASRVDAQGRTRGDRKRAAYARTIAKIKAQQAA